MKQALVLIIGAAMMAASPAYALGGGRWQGEVGIEVVSENGSSFVNIPHRDFWQGDTHVVKQYLEARKGTNYGIVIRNMTPERIGVVIAVDGRNVISGKKSDLKNTEDMYLVNGYQHARYDGWRTDRDTVHRFYFTDLGDSYAMRTFHDTSAMGVIAVAVYREKERPQPLYEEKRLGNAPAAPSVESAAKARAGVVKDEAAGTGFGDAQYSPTVRVAFEAEPAPFQKTFVKYEWREVLCRNGILHCGHESGNRLWDEGEYAPFPQGYREKKMTRQQ
jgi:hypothetical protein